MAARRMRIEMLFACAGLALAAGFSPAFGGWSHPVAPGVSNSNSNLGSTAPVSSATSVLSGTYKYFSATATVNATATANIAGIGSATSIVVQLNLSFNGFVVSSQTFNFASLSSAVQSGSFGELHGYSLVATATPSAAANDIAVSYSIQGPTSLGAVGVVATLPGASVPLNSAAPASTATATATAGLSSNGSGSNSTIAAAQQNVVASADSVAAGRAAVAEVNQASRDAQAAIQACTTNTGACISNAFDAYADKLEAIAPRLPAQLRALPGIVREAADKVRAAKTKTAAENALKSAVVEVDRTIALLKAEDPNAVTTGIPVGRAVDRTLEVAEVKLLRSSGL